LAQFETQFAILQRGPSQPLVYRPRGNKVKCWEEFAEAGRSHKRMLITEIFKSIQGESNFAGLPCVFVRLTGCNLRCHWCDTAYAFHGGQKMTVGEVMARVHQLGGKLVELTGGEPLLQDDVYPLTEQLLGEGFRVLVETSGERYIGRLPQAVIKVLDVKCPGSGEGGTFCVENLGALERKDQIKFVIADENDYRYARDFMLQHDLRSRVDEVILSPVFGQLAPRPLAEWILRDGLGVRLGLQIHKFIWDPETRGV
jgi:7-carboxy-7-deazaguanine synthase